MEEIVRTFTAYDRHSHRYQIDEWQVFEPVYGPDSVKWKAVKRRYQIKNEIIAMTKHNILMKLDGTILLKTCGK